jgi:hypothetical protein
MEEIQHFQKIIMALELQQKDPDEKKEALSDMIDKILVESPSNFWEE